MKIHYLKSLPAFFNDLESGLKNFEIRRNDRGFKPGDMLVLQEIHTGMMQHHLFCAVHDAQRCTCGAIYTGREIARTITYMTDYKQDQGFVVMSIVPAAMPKEEITMGAYCVKAGDFAAFIEKHFGVTHELFPLPIRLAVDRIRRFKPQDPFANVAVGPMVSTAELSEMIRAGQEAQQRAAAEANNPPRIKPGLRVVFKSHPSLKGEFILCKHYPDGTCMLWVPGPSCNGSVTIVCEASEIMPAPASLSAANDLADWMASEEGRRMRDCKAREAGGQDGAAAGTAPATFTPAPVA